VQSFTSGSELEGNDCYFKTNLELKETEAMPTALYLNNKRFIEKSFSREKDFEALAFANSKSLFGRKSILIDAKRKIDNKALGGTIPDAFLFDLKDPNNPEFYLIEVELAKHSFYNHIFPQITKFFAFFKNLESQNELIGKIYNTVTTDANLKKEFIDTIGNQELFKFIKDTIENSQNILLILDNDKKELPEIISTYSDTWGKMVKLSLLKQYEYNGDYILSLSPEFENIDTIDIITNEQDESKTNVYTEGYHLEGITPETKEIYHALKSALIEKISAFKINPQRYYISFRKKRNFAFLQIRKKKIGLVALESEEVIREKIKGYTISTLGESVQRFYNGDCARINIDNINHLDEVINLLIDIQK